MIALAAEKPSLVAQVTRETHEVIEVQRLRYEVFAQEKGARLLGGEPSWDPEFGVADFFILASVECLAARYARRFIGRAEGAPCAS